MSTQVLTASALAVFTLFMVVVLVTSGTTASNTPAPAVATVAQAAQANG